ncbi:MAG: hypothetical protein ABIR79_02610 [Candidatus Binatia bacterium]
MKCRRAFDADLAAVLRGDAGDADFLAHYPTCPDCAAEVQVWRELDGMLRAGAPADAAHPDPEVLLVFVDAPSTLAAAARSDVEQHLAACRVCADELRTLARFDPATLTAAAPAAPAPRAVAAPASPPTVRDDAPSPGGWLGRMVWHPAFAYALVAVLLVPLLRDQLRRIPVATRAVDPRHEERRQAPESAAPVMIGAAPAPAPAAPPPPPSESADKNEKPAHLQDQVAVPAPREADAPAQGSTESKARVAAADGGPRRDAAPARQMAPAPAAPAPIVGLAPFQRERQPDVAAVPAEVARLEREEEPRRPGVAAAPGLEAAFASRARGAMVQGPAPKSDAEVAANLPATVAAGGAGGSIVEVRSSAPTVIPFAVAEEGVLLRIVPPADLAGGALDIQVRGRVGGHAITTRVTDRADAIAVRIPPRWLASGDYVVTLSPVDALPNGAARPSAILGFIVSAPNVPAGGR